MAQVFYGGWYQRTTLHLTEIYSFLSESFTKLDLSKEKLEEFRKNLDLKEVTREVGYLEYVKIITNSGIEVRYYEDGLYVLNYDSDDIQSAKKLLENYYQELFSPAISYLFSLGAPTPKILANIGSDHPVAVSVVSKDHQNYKIAQKFGEVYSELTSSGITVYKTHEYIWVVTLESHQEKARDIIETQIFFREFKDQLEKYLNIHRKIWEEISDIKERKYVKGNEVETLRSKLDQYQKTINLIDSRINQMGFYISTRESICKDLKIENHMRTLFQYKFESLQDTHDYIQEIWKMTKDYLSTAIEALKEIQNSSINKSVTSLQVISSVGVVSGILGYLTSEQLPTITYQGLTYLLLLVAIIWPINLIIKFFSKNRRYQITFPEQTKNL